MGKNSIKNLSLAAFVGLFAFYSFTAHNFRIDSVSTAGMIIKYSKRGLASISCPPTNNAIDETAADRLGDDQCLHHVASKELDNGDVEFTVTTYFNGFTSTGTKVVPAQEAAANVVDNEEFIIGLVRSSKTKFDEAEAATSSNTDLAAAETPEETPAEETAAVDTTPAPAEETNGRPEITMAASSDDDESSSDDSGLDAETLMEAIEDYAKLKIDYNSCQADSSNDRRISKLIKKYDRGIIKYLKKVDEFEESDDEDEKTPLEKLRTRDREKLEAFVAEVDELNSNFDDDEDAAVSTAPAQGRISCLMKRSKSIGDKEAQFNHYVQNIQPLLRQEMQNASQESFDQITKSLNDGSNPISELASNNPYIRGSVQADYLGAKARVLHTENKRLQGEAQNLAEPMRTNQLKQLQLQSDQINTEYGAKLAEVVANNPMLEAHLGGSGQFWAQQIQPLELIGQDLTVNASADSPSVAPPGLDDDVRKRLQAMYDRISAAKKGTGNSRNKDNVMNSGQFDFNTKEYRGESVPQVGDAVSGSIQ